MRLNELIETLQKLQRETNYDAPVKILNKEYEDIESVSIEIDEDSTRKEDEEIICIY